METFKKNKTAEGEEVATNSNLSLYIRKSRLEILLFGISCIITPFVIIIINSLINGKDSSFFENSLLIIILILGLFISYFGGLLFLWDKEILDFTFSIIKVSLSGLSFAFLVFSGQIYSFNRIGVIGTLSILWLVFILVDLLSVLFNKLFNWFKKLPNTTQLSIVAVIIAIILSSNFNIDILHYISLLR